MTSSRGRYYIGNRQDNFFGCDPISGNVSSVPCLVNMTYKSHLHRCEAIQQIANNIDATIYSTILVVRQVAPVVV